MVANAGPAPPRQRPGFAPALCSPPRSLASICAAS